MVWAVSGNCPIICSSLAFCFYKANSLQKGFRSVWPSFCHSKRNWKKGINSETLRSITENRCLTTALLWFLYFQYKRHVNRRPCIFTVWHSLEPLKLMQNRYKIRGASCLGSILAPLVRGGNAQISSKAHREEKVQHNVTSWFIHLWLPS